MKTLLCIGLLLSLSSVALSLKCRYFKNITAMAAESISKKQCQVYEDSCSANVERTNIWKNRLEVMNLCFKSEDCHPGNYSITGGDGKFFEMKVRCCKTDLCNNATLSLSERNKLAENGLQCPSCFSKGKEKCKSEKTVNCLENETQCIDFKGSIKAGFFLFYNFTIKGCGTTDICDMKKNGIDVLHFGRFGLFVTQESCYNASQISHQPEQKGTV